MITLGFDQKAGARARRAHSQIDFFLEMCAQVARFMQENDGQHFQAFVARDNGLIGLYLVTAAAAYNFELSRKLADFAAPYIQRGLLDSASLLPSASVEELEAFFDPKRALKVAFEHA